MIDSEIVRTPISGPRARRSTDLAPADHLYEFDTEEISAKEALSDDLTERGIGPDIVEDGLALV